MKNEDLLPRLPERVGVIKVDLTTVYPRRKDAPEECEVEVFRVPTMRELYGIVVIDEPKEPFDPARAKAFVDQIIANRPKQEESTTCEAK